MTFDTNSMGTMSGKKKILKQQKIKEKMGSRCSSVVG
jgi:hypothetical protein